MKKKVISIIFISFLVAGIFVSVANFTFYLDADELPPGFYEGTAIDNPQCTAGWECVDDGGHTCDAQQGRGCT